MDRKKIIELLHEKKVQDYSFNIFFFLAFSVFLLFAIRPNILTAFNLQRELKELNLKNKEAENVILQIVNYQSVMENYRDKITLLDEAVPSSPGLAKAIDDVKSTASASGLLVSEMTVESVEFSDVRGSGELQTFQILLTSEGSTVDLNSFISQVLKQRRLKMFESVEISSESETATKITLTIKSYYL